MKLKISEINSNPHKKEINKGELDEETISKIMANLDELGLMSPLPVFKKKNQFFLIYGHHRLEALKRKHGEDYQVTVELKDYNEDQVLRGMIVENLTQRSNEFHDELDNLLIIRKYLQNKNPSAKRTGLGGRGITEKAVGSCRDIAQWLDKNTGDVMKKSKISDILNMADNLDEELLENVEKQSHKPGKKTDDSIGVKVAACIATIKDKQEQKDVAKAVLNSKESHQDIICKSITAYKNAPREIKQQIRQLQLDIADVEEAIITNTRENEYEEETLYFTPNFASQIKSFNKDVIKLEKQVAFFNRIFNDKQFKEKYYNLESKKKKLLDTTIFNIYKRIEKCQKQVEVFMEKIPDKILLEGGKNEEKNE